MHTSEPHLQNVLLSVVRFTERILSEESSPLIDGNCMPDNMEVRIFRGPRKRKRHGIVDPSYGADRVPYTHEMCLTFTRKSVPESIGDRKVDLLSFCHPDCVRDQSIVVLCEKPDEAKQSGEGSGSVGSTAEAEDIHAIAGLKNSHEELIGVCDVIRKAIAKGETDHARLPSTYGAERVSSTHRADAGVVIGELGGIADQRLIEPHHVGVLRPELTSRAVTADHDILRHFRRKRSFWAVLK